MENMIPAKVHWLSIARSVVVVVLFSAASVAILVRRLQQDVHQNSQGATDEVSLLFEQPSQAGWKVVHADVFRPPPSGPVLLCVCCGAGAQLLCAGLLTVISATIGFASQARNGQLLATFLWLYVVMGAVNGYVAARLHKTFEGESWREIARMASLSFPGIAFALFFFIDVLVWGKGSSGAVPFKTIVVLLFLWLGISTPLVFAGARIGFKHGPIDYPADTSPIARPIPAQPWPLSLPVIMLLGGILPFGCCFVEIYYIMGSAWLELYYNSFGFLLTTIVLMLVLCAETTVLCVYFQLNCENYQWWWRSFASAGATGLSVFGYSVLYFPQLEANVLAAYILYFGYMALVSLAIFLAMGTVGVASGLWFSKALFTYGRDKEIWVEMDGRQAEERLLSRNEEEAEASQEEHHPFQSVSTASAPS
jgi:transmembrane 9 superfamily protein 2/4